MPDRATRNAEIGVAALKAALKAALERANARIRELESAACAAHEALQRRATTREQTLRAAAIALLRNLAALDEKHERYIAALRELQPTASDIEMLPAGVEENIIDLVDAIFDADQLAKYLRWETRCMRDGGSITINDRTYPIRTVDDVAAYLDAEYPLGAPK